MNTKLTKEHVIKGMLEARKRRRWRPAAVSPETLRRYEEELLKDKESFDSEK